MTTRQSRPRNNASDALTDRKINELVDAHGTFVRELIDSGRLPAREIGNFYGRHFDRREAILSAMQAGKTYSAAYKASSGYFDTKRWEKIPNRTAACRGHLLKTTAGLFAKGTSEIWSAIEIAKVEEIATALVGEAKQLIQQIARYDITASSKKAQPRKALPIPCEVENCKTTFTSVAGQLNTALTKLKKNNRDAPLLVEKIGCGPTVHDVARIVVEAGRIINGVPLFLIALKSDSSTNGPATSVRDSWGIGIEYAAWVEGQLPPPRPEVRIATHKDPDADALVSTWLTERFLFLNSKCQIEFVAEFVPDAGCPFDAVLDVGRKHNKKRLLFDHKPPAFHHRDDNCASSLVWRHAQLAGCQVDNLRGFVELVHDGDAATRRQQSAAYRHSRASGFHAVIRAARAYAQNDQMLYQGIGGYLDVFFADPN